MPIEKAERGRVKKAQSVGGDKMTKPEGIEPEGISPLPYLFISLLVAGDIHY